MDKQSMSEQSLHETTTPTAAQDFTARRRGNPAWVPGVSGNPAGKPPGTRNRATILLDDLIEDEVPELAKAALARAKAGHIGAMKLCFDRLPARRDRAVPLTLPYIVSAADAGRALAAIIAAVGDGVLTPSEAATLSAMVESAVRTLAEAEKDR